MIANSKKKEIPMNSKLSAGYHPSKNKGESVDLFNELQNFVDKTGGIDLTEYLKGCRNF